MGRTRLRRNGRGEYRGQLIDFRGVGSHSIKFSLGREHHNETLGILICGTKNDRSVRYSLGRSTSPMAVAAYTYDKLPPSEQQALPNEGHIVAALEWAEPDSEESAP